MSFRNEDKLFIHHNKIGVFKKYLRKRGAIQIYKPRIVKSTYFDNKNFDMYHNSIEGTVPRKKIRIREYPEFKNKLFIEKKISSVEGRFKTSNKLNSFNYFKTGIKDKEYGLCKPVSIVSYKRLYLSLNKVRITIDEDIRYQKFNFQRVYQEKLVVAELKYPFDFHYDSVEFNFPFERIRFSKYCNSIEKIFNI